MTEDEKEALEAHRNSCEELGIAFPHLSGSLISASGLWLPTMEKLDAFSRITEDSMEALVQTDDIEQQKEKAWEETEKWAESAIGEKVTKTSKMVISWLHRKFMLLRQSSMGIDSHRYTGWKEEMHLANFWYNQNDFHVLVRT